MKTLINHTLLIALFYSFLLSHSCNKVETEFDCGVIATKILKLNQTIGAFKDSRFSSIPSTEFEAAAIRIEIDQISPIGDCFAWTPDPQIIQVINITSTSSIFTRGKEYLANENLNELFKIHLDNQTFTISSFLQAHIEDPAIFYSDDHFLVLQLLNKPDMDINQSLKIEFSFDDGESVMIQSSTFEVSN